MLVVVVPKFKGGRSSPSRDTGQCATALFFICLSPRFHGADCVVFLCRPFADDARCDAIATGWVIAMLLKVATPSGPRTAHERCCGDRRTRGHPVSGRDADPSPRAGARAAAGATSLSTAARPPTTSRMTSLVANDQDVGTWMLQPFVWCSLMELYKALIDDAAAFKVVHAAIWTVLHYDGPIQLGLWSERRRRVQGALRREVLPAGLRSPPAARCPVRPPPAPGAGRRTSVLHDSQRGPGIMRMEPPQGLNPGRLRCRRLPSQSRARCRRRCARPPRNASQSCCSCPPLCMCLRVAV